MEFKAAIFDLDGTLFDTMAVWQNAGSSFLKDLGVELDEQGDENIRKMTLEQSTRYMIEEFNLGFSSEELVDKIYSFLKKEYIEKAEPKPYVIEYLKLLKSKGIKMCINTANFLEFAQLVINKYDMNQYFEFIISCNEIGDSKTNPQVFIDTAHKLGSEIKDTAVFEDNYYCIKTANKIGLKTVGVADTLGREYEDEIKKIADKYIYSFEELIK